MKPAKAALSREQWAALLLGMTGLFGLITRLFPALITGFPLNDGGMFLVMIRDLRLNGFLLPAYTSYNFGGIPFVYPPLGIYIAGILNWTGLPELELLRWLPIVFNLLSIPAFYLLTRTLLDDAPRAAAATLIFALIPGSFSWWIMGGGLTRAAGMLFLILAQAQVLRMFRMQGLSAVWLAMLFCSLTVLSHPEAGLAAASSCALFFIFFGRSRQGLIRAGAVAAGTLLLTTPWWISVLSMHGFSPFLNAFYSGQYHVNPITGLAGMLFPVDAWTGVFHLLTLAGLIWSLYKRQIFLPLWLALPWLVEPRSAPAYAYLPAVILSAQVLAEAVPAVFSKLRSKSAPPAADAIESNGLRALFLGLGLVWFLQSALFGFTLRNSSLLPPEPQQAMAWVKENTPPESRFLLLTGNGDSMTDPLQEWFPALAMRKSQTTLQGQEWMLGEQFLPHVRQLASLQTCEDAACLERWSHDSQLNFSHAMVERNSKTNRLVDSLSRDSRYEVVYENDGYVVFER